MVRAGSYCLNPYLLVLLLSRLMPPAAGLNRTDKGAALGYDAVGEFRPSVLPSYQSAIATPAALLFTNLCVINLTQEEINDANYLASARSGMFLLPV